MARPRWCQILSMHHVIMLTLVFLGMALGQNRANALADAHMSPQLSTKPETTPSRLVLIGGGHAHAQVVKALKLRSPNMRVTLIDLEKSASYSGMIPGCVAGLYTPDQTLIHLEPLCDWADVEFLQDEVVDIDLERKCVVLRHAPNPIPYDAVSLDIGSKSRGLDDIPGAREYSIPTRPISKLVQRIQDAEMMLGETSRVVVVGGGAAGIELAMSIRGRWGPLLGDQLQVTLLDAGEELLPTESRLCRDSLHEALKDRRVEVRHKCQVEEVTSSHVRLESGESIAYTHCIWAAGAAAHSLAGTLQRRGLAVSDRGWIRVNANLQSISHSNVFAAGDCCTFEGPSDGRPPPPKAGVYAVRAGPVLSENLPSFLQSKEHLELYNPQDDFLKLFSFGDGTAIGFRFGIPLQGKWVFEMKDSIDQMFMDLFKEENLTNWVDAVASKSQFDALIDDDEVRLSPEAAASLLQRKDSAVNYKAAWYTIRQMTRHADFRQAVMKHIGQALIPQ